MKSQNQDHIDNLSLFKEKFIVWGVAEANPDSIRELILSSRKKLKLEELTVIQETKGPIFNKKKKL